MERFGCLHEGTVRLEKPCELRMIVGVEHAAYLIDVVFLFDEPAESAN
jgi:hypothetical protein